MRCQNTFLFFLVDGAGRSAFWEDNTVKWQTTPKPLQFSPDGWRDTQVGFTRSGKYFGINRQLTNSYKFVEDGASIIRYLLYRGQSYESKLYLIVTRWNDLTDLYEAYYRGEIDLVKANDDPVNGITVNMIEGDLLKLLNANDDIDYEIPLAGQLDVEMSPVALSNVVRYGVANIEVGLTTDFVPVVFLLADQELPGFIYQGQTSNITDPLAFFFYTELKQTINITGSVSMKPAGSGTYTLAYLINTNGTTTTIYVANGVSVTAGQTYTYDIGQTIDVPANSSIQLVVNHTWAFNDAEYFETEFQIDYDYRFPATTAKAIRPFELYKAILTKVFGAQSFTSISELLETTNKNLVLTSGDALRGISGAVIKTSFAKFFEAFNKILFAGFGVSGLNTILETRQYFYKTDTVTLNIGDVSDMNITIAEDQIFNSAKVGYPSQDIGKLNGRYSFNNTNVFSLPVNRVKKQYDQVCQYITDPFVIENNRISFNGKDTTDDKNDNTVFILNVTNKEGLTGVSIEFSDSPVYTLLLIDRAADIDLFYEGAKFFLRNAIYTDTGTYTVISATVIGSDLSIDIGSTAYPGEYSFTADIEFPLQLLRETYSSITGIPEDSGAYNIEQLTPKRMLQAHSPFYRSILYFLSLDKMAFTTAERNKDLVTVLDGVTVSESADVRADTLGTPLFYPFVFGFKTRVPDTFINIFNDAVNGHVQFTYNGFTMYGFPVQMNAKPALNEAQEWKLLASPLCNLAALTDLLANPLNSLNMSTYGLSFSKLCPVQFVPENVTPDSRYHTRHMDTGTFYQQSTRYAGYQPYQQKWQTNDTIKLQCITRALGPVNIDVIDKYGRIYDTVVMDGITTTAVTTPYQLYECDVDLSGLTPGIYWLKCTAGITGTQVTFISEPLDIQVDWDKTLLLEYSNTRNQAATIFSTGYSPNFRIEGQIIDFTPKSRFSSYEDEPANMYLLEGVAYRQFGLFIGDSFGLPPYMADKVNRIFTLNTVSIDGRAFVRDEDSQLEAVGRIQGMPGTWWKLNIREASNNESTSQDGEGVIDPAVVLINVDTALFGDLTGQVSSNPVQITVLNP